MLRKNQEEKKLKLNKPIMSARRDKDQNREIDDSISSVPQPVDPVRSPGVVPFNWEEIPGKPKDETNLKSAKSEQHCFDKALEKLSLIDSEEEQQEENVYRDKPESFSSSKNSMEREHEIYETRQEKDLISKPNFMFLDYKTGSNRVSPKTQDIMIGMFVPAPKTMASEIPLYGSEKPKPRNVVAKEPSFSWRDNRETKTCGSVPRLCVRSSIFILNPMPPPMNVKTRSHSSRTQRYSFAFSCNDERSISDLNKQKQANGRNKSPQTWVSKAVVPAHNAGVDALRTCKKFCRKLQELMSDHSNTMPEKTLHMIDSTMTKKQHFPELDLSFRDIGDINIVEETSKTKTFARESFTFDLSAGITSDDDESDNDEIDESFVRQMVSINRELKHSEDMNLEFIGSPPLPQSPSESWLLRTLPSLSSASSSPSRPCL